MSKRSKTPRGERRYVIVTDSRDGAEYRVLTSVAGAGCAFIEFQPSNEHRAGQLAGMLITHGARSKGLVFNDQGEAAVYINGGRRLETMQRVPEAERSQYYAATVREIAV